MKQYYASDAHKRYSVFGSINEAGEKQGTIRIEHDREKYHWYLKTLPEGSVIALESLGNWYWQVEEMEKAGHVPVLVHARKAKMMMGHVHKTDKLDVYGLATMNRNGTLPAVWIADKETRDHRELPRMRMAMVAVRTKFKNRIHSTLAKYNIQIDEVSDVFGVEGQKIMRQRIEDLPPETKRSVIEQSRLLKEVEERIETAEKRIREVVQETAQMGYLRSLPGFGPILTIIVALEIGDVDRFADAARLASYSGVVPRVHSSGGKTYYSQTAYQVNRYLKWAFIEAANVVVLNQRRQADSHAVKLYQRIREAKGHAKAVVALARHLAESAYWVLKKKEMYKEPGKKMALSTQG